MTKVNSAYKIHTSRFMNAHYIKLDLLKPNFCRLFSKQTLLKIKTTQTIKNEKHYFKHKRKCYSENYQLSMFLN